MNISPGLKMVIARSGNVYATVVVPVASAKSHVTILAVYDVCDNMTVSHSRKLVGKIAQSVMTAVHTRVHGVGVRRSLTAD